MDVHPRLGVDQDQLAELCRRHGVAKLGLFGSVLGEEFGPDSDVDVVVEFEPGTRVSYFTLGGLQQDLSDLFGRHVDLKTPTTLSKYIAGRVLDSLEPVYPRR
jgi:predicted nucleotidyltransferase